MTTLKQEIKDLFKDLQGLESKVLILKHLIQQKQDELQSVCDHEWERDWMGYYDHKTHYVCKKCDLYR